MRILGFGTYDSSRQPRVAVLLAGLAELGAEVDELNRPLGLTTAERVEILHKPWLGYRLLFRLLQRWSALSWARVRRRPKADAVVVGYLAQFDVVLARLLFPRSIIVLDLLVFADDTARDRGVSSGPRLVLLRLLDRFAVTCADLVLVDTDENAALVPPGHEVEVVRVGAGADWFAAGRDDRPSPSGRLHVVFFGLFTPLQGAPVIAEAVASLPADVPLSLTMIGTGQDYERARAVLGTDPRVRWIPWVGSDELPSLVAEHDVCLGIFGGTPKALRVIPTKVYQGAAAGCAIVTSDTPPQRRALGESAVFVPPGDAAALARALAYLSRRPDEVLNLARLARERAAADFEPHTIALPVARALSTRKNRSAP